jgi:hypothetical protein
VAGAEVSDVTLLRPTQEDVRGWSAASYMASFEQHDARLLAEVAQRLVVPPNHRDEDVLRAHLADSQRLLQQGLADCQAMPAYRGNDALLKAAQSSYEELLSVTEGDALAMIVLRTGREISQDDVQAAEALQRRINDSARRALERLDPARAAFAVQFSLAVPEPVVLASPRVFMVPDLPPEGSALDAATYVRFSHRYFAQSRAQADAIAAAYVQARTALQPDDPSQMKTARMAALQNLRTVQITASEDEDWLGDDSLRAANAALLESLVALLEGPYADYQAVLQAHRKLRSADRDVLTRLEAEIVAATDQARQARQQADAAFVQRWHIALYAEWLADHP